MSSPFPGGVLTISPYSLVHSWHKSTSPPSPPLQALLHPLHGPARHAHHQLRGCGAHWRARLGRALGGHPQAGEAGGGRRGRERDGGRPREGGREGSFPVCTRCHMHSVDCFPHSSPDTHTHAHTHTHNYTHTGVRAGRVRRQGRAGAGCGAADQAVPTQLEGARGVCVCGYVETGAGAVLESTR